MKYNVISYFLGEGFRNILKNKKSTFSCLGVMCATMLIFGLFFAIGKNINSAIEDLEKEQGMQIFMTTNATEAQIDKLKQELKQIDGINSITFETKEQAYNNMKSRLGSKSSVMEGLSPEIFKVSYIITLTELSLNNQVLESVRALDNVDNIQNKADTINKLSQIGRAIRIITIIIFAILILISLFIISNTIKLTVHSRRKEISIMKYVGATNGFIRSPFIVEGVIIGLLSGILSIILVGAGYNFIANKLLQSGSWREIGISLLNFGDILTQIIIVYMILGVGIGVIGSSISMKKYLDV